jgi:hypothetical protein
VSVASVVVLALGLVTDAEASHGFQAHYLNLGANDRSYGLATDAAGSVFVVSTVTGSSGQPQIRATETDAQGTVLASFDFGINEFAFPAAAVTDPQGNLIVTGTAYSNSPSTTHVSTFVVKFDNQLKRILGATTLDGLYANALVVDGSGNTYVAGTGGAADLVTPGAFQTTPPTVTRFGGPTYAFLVKLSPDLGQILFGTYFGGGQTDCFGGSACIGVYAGTGITSLALDSL